MADLTEAQKRRVMKAISERFGQNKAGPICPICGQTQWGLQAGGLVHLTLQSPSVQGVVLGGPQLPNIALVCEVCGNTHLLNLFVLGVADVFGLEMDKSEPAPAEAQPAPSVPSTEAR